MNFFELLSVDNIIDITKMLDQKTLCRLIMTCKEFKKLCDTNDMWKYHYMLTIKDKWKITENSIHIGGLNGGIIYLYEFYLMDEKYRVKSCDKPTSRVIRNMEQTTMWDYRKNVKYLGIYRGSKPFIPCPQHYMYQWQNPVDYVINYGCMCSQRDLIKRSGIIYAKPQTMGIVEWREDIMNKWKKVNEENGIQNLCQNPDHYLFESLEMPESCRNYKNYKKMVVKKLYTKYKKEKEEEKYIRENKKFSREEEELRHKLEVLKYKKELNDLKILKTKRKMNRIKDAIDIV